jgi:hypothetical protein
VAVVCGHDGVSSALPCIVGERRSSCLRGNPVDVLQQCGPLTWIWERQREQPEILQVEPLEAGNECIEAARGPVDVGHAGAPTSDSCHLRVTCVLAEGGMVGSADFLSITSGMRR